MCRVERQGICLALFLASLAGCAGVPKPAGWIADVRPQRVKRSSEAAKAFDREREQSEYQAAASQFQQGDAKGCRKVLEGLLKRNPKHRDARLLLAQLSLLEQQAAPAREQLERALIDYPDDAELLHTMGLAAEMEGKSDEAVSWFERAVKLVPDNEVYAMSFESAVEDRAAAARAAMVTDKQKPSSRRKTPAAGEARRVSHESAQPGRDAAALGDAGETAASKLRFAEPAAEPGSAAEPRSAAESKIGDSADRPRASGLATAKDLIDRGGAALAAGAVETARGYFDRACKAAPDDEGIRISATVAALRHDELDLAAELAEEALEQFPDSAGLYRVLGTAQYRQGDLRPAKSSLERALALDNSSALSYFLLGSTLAKLGETQAAEWHLSQARRLDPRFVSRR